MRKKPYRRTVGNLRDYEQLNPFRGLFKHQLTSVYWRSELNLKLNFETQSFKPKNKKVIKTI